MKITHIFIYLTSFMYYKFMFNIFMYKTMFIKVIVYTCTTKNNPFKKFEI